jgi:hypothetical protein
MTRLIFYPVHYLSMKEDNFFDREDGIGSNFWKFYLIRISFTLGEPISLVKVFRVFRLERILLEGHSVHRVGRCRILAGPACL